MLKLEEVLALSALMQMRVVDAQISATISIANHVRPDMYYGCLEQTILESYTEWMRQAAALFEAAKDKNGTQYANLTLAEFITQSRPDE